MNLVFPIVLLIAAFMYIFSGSGAPNAIRRIYYGRYYAEEGVSRADDVPNSPEAFEGCIESDMGIMVRTMLSADGKPVVISYDDLSKAGLGEGRVSETDSRDLEKLGVMDLAAFLTQVNARVPVIIELLSGDRNELLCRRVADVILSHGNKAVAVCSFHRGITGWFRNREKDIFRGIITAPGSSFVALDPFSKFMTGNMANNSIARPQLILYRNRPMNFLAKIVYNMGPIKGVWTLTDPDEAKALEEDRGIIISRGFTPEKPYYRVLAERTKLRDEIRKEEKAARKRRAAEAKKPHYDREPSSGNHLDDYYGEFHPESVAEFEESMAMAEQSVSIAREAEKISERLEETIRSENDILEL